MNDQNDLTETEAEAEQGLNLEEEDRLPWLESAEDYSESESSAGRILGLIVLGLIALALVVGAIYWLQSRGQEVPDGYGSLIAAPEGNYKTAPDDVQATEVEGTGDSSFAASQGQKSEGQLAGSGAGEPANGVLVQLGAFSSEALAQNGWNSMAQRFDYVGGMSKRISEAQVDGGTVYRLSAVAPDANAANAVCERLKKAGENCLVIR